ncbi:MAG: peroxiredoxin family protein [Gemmatimonadales bacterium]
MRKPILAAALLCMAALLPNHAAAQSTALGPVDGLNLSPVDVERVAVGSTAPDFTLAVYRGDTFTLSSLRGSKNVVLVFYRGWWCPYCMTQLTEMRNLLDADLATDTELVVVSIDGDEENGRTFARIARDDGREPDYMFLSDPESKVIGRYGVLNPDGGRRGAIPHPAVFVIDKQGIVRWRDVQIDYTIRPSNEAIRTALRAVRGR